MMIRSTLLLAALAMAFSATPVRADEEAMDRPTAPPKALPVHPPKAEPNKVKAGGAKKGITTENWSEKELKLAPAPLPLHH
jgi:hypothetical protein